MFNYRTNYTLLSEYCKPRFPTFVTIRDTSDLVEE